MLMRGIDIFNDVLGLKNLVDGYFDSSVYAKKEKSPLVNLYENGDTVTAKILVPGAKTEDITLELTDNILQLSVQRKNENSETTYIRRERSYGTFSKSIRIPFRVNQDSIKAELSNGILSVTLEKSEDAKPRKITIV
jgi:HSP20 family protein